MECLFCSSVATKLISVHQLRLYDLELCDNCACLSSEIVGEKIQKLKDTYTEQQVLLYLVRKANKHYHTARGTAIPLYPNLDSVIWSTISAEICLFQRVDPLGQRLAEFRDAFNEIFLKTGDVTLYRRASHYNFMLQHVDNWGERFTSQKYYLQFMIQAGANNHFLPGVF